MKAFRFWVLFILVVAAALMFFFISFPVVMTKSSSLSVPGTALSRRDSCLMTTARERKLVVEVYEYKSRTAARKRDVGRELNLDDYRPIDPAPSSKAAVKPGPIQHGTPLNPYIPKRPPPPPPPPPRGLPKSTRG